MERICDYIKKLRKPYNQENMHYSVVEYGIEMDMSISQMRKILNKKIGKTIRNVKVFPENWSSQRKIIISFRYKNLHCEIKEHFDTQLNYMCVVITEILPVIN